jgi:hypothetical protein
VLIHHELQELIRLQIDAEVVTLAARQRPLKDSTRLERIALRFSLFTGDQADKDYEKQSG